MSIVLRMLKEQKPAPGKKTKAKEKEPFLDGQGQPAQAPAMAPGTGRKILVVDDNEVVLKAFQTKLKCDGFEVFTLTNATSVAGTAEQEQTELIILDINFPPAGGMEWNGFTIMQWLRRFPEIGNIPVILISGSETAKYKEKALQAGAVAFFEKPVDYSTLLSAILQSLPPKPKQ